MKADELQDKEQGPQHCAQRCYELGMEMGALVLVSNQLPGCVCQPRGVQAARSSEGASAATTSYVVIAAAAAAARQQQAQQHRSVPAATGVKTY